MKQSPFPSLAAFGRALAKALLIALTLNFALLASGLNPVRALVQVNTWGLVGAGRARLAYPSDFQNGQLPAEALLAAHAIRQPKTPDEYRVILFGESGVAGWGVPDEATLAAQLTGLGLTLDGRRLVAYNLAYPQPSIPRDLLLLDAALAYRPDLVIWFVTPAALDAAPDAAGQNRVFFTLNRARLEALIQRHPALLGGWYAEQAPLYLPPEPGWRRVVGIRDQELLPIWLNSLFYPFVPPELAESERRIGSEPVPDEPRYTDDSPGFREMPGPAWQFLRAGCLDATGGGAQLLVVNEPMVIGSGPNSERSYNLLYERALYDRYRAALARFASEHALWYADLWDVIPPRHFTDTPTHMDAEGHALLAQRLAEVLEAGGGSRCE